jgi:protocatechuate 3,4-dioxygenase beta subunit
MWKIVLWTLLALSWSGLLSPNGGFVHAGGGLDRFQCEPTPPDLLGPYYKPGAPIRNQVGEGYVLAGTVKSAADCAPVEGARIEFWQAGTGGVYDGEFRAAVLSDASGKYSFETVFPGTYASRPPHIHLMVNAQGFETLVTQHYPEPGAESATFDLVLIPTP